MNQNITYINIHLTYVIKTCAIELGVVSRNVKEASSKETITYCCLKKTKYELKGREGS